MTLGPLFSFAREGNNRQPASLHLQRRLSSRPISLSLPLDILPHRDSFSSTSSSNTAYQFRILYTATDIEQRLHLKAKNPTMSAEPSPTTNGSSAQQQPQPPPLRSALKSDDDIERPLPPSGSLKGVFCKYSSLSSCALHSVQCKASAMGSAQQFIHPSM